MEEKNLKKKLLLFSPSLSTTNALFPRIPIFQDLTGEFDIYICCDVNGKGGTESGFFEHIGIKDFFEYSSLSKRKKIHRMQFHINTLGAKKYLRAGRVIYNANKKRYGNLMQRIIHRTLGSSYYSARAANYLFEKYVGEDANIRNIVNAIKPDLMITSLSGNTALEIDAIKCAKLSGVPIMGLQFSWDSLSNRGLMPFQPDYMGVWGYQCRFFAEKVHKMPAERVFHIGAFFDDMLKAEPDRSGAEIRSKLGLPEYKRVLFFAGNIWAYNEVRNLKLINDSIENGILKDCCVLYRPHPFQHKPEGDINFFEQDLQHIYVDPDLAEQYKVGQQKDKRLLFKKSMEVDYMHIKEMLLISSITIAPLSTMMIQSAACGTPVVGLLYVDRANEQYRFRFENDMLDILKAMPGVSFCMMPEKLLDYCVRALECSEDKLTTDAMQRSAGDALYSDSLSYSQRLRNAINSIFWPQNHSVYDFLGHPVHDIKRKQNIVDFEKNIALKIHDNFNDQYMKVNKQT